MGVSRLESLPLELLQPIFIASGHNIALIQASDRIAARLSSKYVYHSVCNYYLIGKFENHARQSFAQTYIFNSKWMTWTFFKSWMERSFAHIGCLCGLTTEEGCFDPQWPPDYEDATRMVFSRSHLPRIAFVKGRLPQKLLRGSWTTDKVQFLRFLLWITSMTVDWSDAEMRDIAVQGRKQAMLEKNLGAVELFNHNRRLGKVASLETVIFAVTQAGCDRSIVYDTLFTANMWGARGPNWDSAVLDAWCKERIKAGDPKGQWLKTKLHELRVINDPYGSTSRGIDKDQDGDMDPTVGDYDGGDDDRLVVNELEWNKVSVSFRILASFLRRILSR